MAAIRYARCGYFVTLPMVAMRYPLPAIRRPEAKQVYTSRSDRHPRRANHEKLKEIPWSSTCGQR